MPSLPRRAARPLVVLIACATAMVASPGSAYAEPRVSDVDRQIAAASARLEILVEQHNAARADLAATRVRAVATASRVAGLASGLRAARERVTAIGVWAYKTGPTSQLSGVLEAGSPAAFVDRITTLDSLARADLREITGLIDLSAAIDADQQALGRLETQQSAQEAALGSMQAQVERDIAALRALRTQIGTASRRAPTPVAAPPAGQAPHVNGAAGRAVAFAYAQIGRPYQWGADGPGSYDCSGLTSAAWRAAGVVLAHNAARQFSAMQHVSRGQLQPGDLVFYYADVHHVAIYVGDGNVIHAPDTDQNVRVAKLDLAPVHGYGRPS